MPRLLPRFALCVALAAAGGHALSTAATAAAAAERSGESVEELSDIAAPYVETWRGLKDFAHSAHEYSLALRAPMRKPTVSLMQTFTSLTVKEDKPAPALVAQPSTHDTKPVYYKPPVKKVSTMDLFIDGLSWVILYSLCALIYRYTHPIPVADGEDGRDVAKYGGEFEYRLFDSRKCSCDLAFCSFCCISIRWAATVSDPRVGTLLTFWPAFFILILLQGFAPLLWGTAWIIFLAVVILYRQKIRVHYGLEHGTFETYLEDCCAWWCCPCFAAGQEAKQVEHVRVFPPPSGGNDVAQDAV